MAKFILLSALLALLSVSSMTGCTRSKDLHNRGRSERLLVVATLFPIYDFARNIAGDRAEVKLLLPPGSEPHSFEPRTSDMVMLDHADIFIYTNRFMEPWAEKLLKGRGSKDLTVVDAGSGVRFIEGSIDGAEGSGDHQYDESGRKSRHHEREVHGSDPHIWLDFGNAQKMVDTIADAFIEKDPANRELYKKNAEAYRARLEVLDSSYQRGLSNCGKRIFINGGHHTFGYLAGRYGLRYRAAYGLSPDAEPTARNLVDISRSLRREGLTYLFFEELLNPRIADTIAKETGATLLKLHGAHNISKDEFNANRTFIELMERNLANLMTGLQCR